MNQTPAIQYLLSLRREIAQFWKATKSYLESTDEAFVPYEIPQQLNRFLDAYVKAAKTTPDLATNEIAHELLKIERTLERYSFTTNCSAPRGYETIEAIYKANPTIATADLCLALFRRGPGERPYEALAKLIEFDPKLASPHIADCIRKCINRQDAPFRIRSTAFQMFQVLQDKRPDLFSPEGPVRPLQARPIPLADRKGLHS